MPFEIKVAIPTPMDRLFSYQHHSCIEAGARVQVVFNRRKVVGVVLESAEISQEELKAKPFRLLRVSELVDPTPIYSPAMLKLGEFLARYYMHPVGEVLKTMLPGGNKKKVKRTWTLVSNDLGLAAEGLGRVFAKKKSLSEATFFKKCKAEGLIPKDLQAAKLVRCEEVKSIAVRDEFGSTSGKDALELKAAQGQSWKKPAVTLNEEQQHAVDEITASFNQKELAKPFLLHGVTGSGKTEVFLHSIERLLILDPLAQVCVLVPEISLTPQMTMVFEQRFPGKVGVVHSNMDEGERWSYLLRVKSGELSVLIGPRSCVFAPYNKLRLIIVDEEHDSSYKQSSGLMYNGRDVAVVRAKIENATVLLGSATPSLESYYNADQKKYQLLALRKRATEAVLPEVVMVKSKAAQRVTTNLEDGGGSSPFEPSVIKSLRDNAEAGNQALVLVNRRGTAYYLMDVEKREPVQCPDCSISMTLHKRATLLRCHYCSYQIEVKTYLERSGQSAQFLAIGYGSEKATDSLKEALPSLRIERLDSDVAQKRGELLRLLDTFRKHEIDILVGTQILAKGHDFSKVRMIALLEVDQMLNLPDFRSAERTFQLMVQAAGRAGRSGGKGEVLLQTSRDSHPVVQAGLSHDYHSFVEEELLFRRLHGYPPYGRMILVEYNSEDCTQLLKFDHRVHSWLNHFVTENPEIFKNVKVLGPSIPAIEVVRRRHRRMMIWTSTQTSSMRHALGIFLKSFEKTPSSIRLRVDVDPQSIL